MRGRMLEREHEIHQSANNEGCMNRFLRGAQSCGERQGKMKRAFVANKFVKNQSPD